ncbi:hypothetical protein LOTGIDRAFT_164269 [Lottia gigantea]|uniref:Apple domain-containing protein n=1 Tax=Lottia gigantea TaxID=225164 RepID=V3ZGM4_LOTGI|nr:hypothetical protein LOTGIDRAFT_164269 [Lottia gigantea]ESO90348.1 hypothetical protein LOTGIDRAFT_164269 [Lottia gigantea]
MTFSLYTSACIYQPVPSNCTTYTHCSDGRKVVECDYTYSNNKYIDHRLLERISEVPNQNDCDQECNDNTQCTAALQAQNNCYLYGAPIISLSQNTDLTQCEESCNQMNECITLSFHGDVNRCYIFNVTVANLPSNFHVNEADGDTIAEKVFN